MFDPVIRSDFTESAQRMTAFWEKRELDRPCVWVTAPRDIPLPGPVAPKPPEDLEQLWTNLDYLLAAADFSVRHTWYGGEAVPMFVPQLGPGSMAVHLGSKPVFWPSTIWYAPCIEDLSSGPDLQYNRNEKWWLWQQEAIQRGRVEGEGKWVVTFPDLIENLDILASLRGSEGLLEELIFAPEAIHRYQKQILELYFRYYDELATLLEIPRQGSVFVGFPGWGAGRVCKLQCDMSCMISPAMFREFVLPYLADQCLRVDHAFYHLDGPDAIKHLDALLEIPQLHGIQWTPGSGHPPFDSEVWWPMLHKIQDAGKSLFLLGVPSERVPVITAEFDTNLLLIATWESSQANAQRLLASL